MGEKIWFVYISDHHEGPFTPEEVQAKIAEGAVTSQSLVWKDGMPEWVAAETIPEIHALFSGGAESPAAPALTVGDGGEASLAQLLSQEQTGDAPVAEPGQTLEQVSEQAPMSLDSLPTGGGAAPGDDDQVWSMRSGTSVSGQFSMSTLKEMAGRGEVPADAEFWHPGMTDFTPLAAYPELEKSRKSPKPTTAKPLASPGRKPGGLAPLTAAATVGSEDEFEAAPPKKAGKLGVFTEKLKGMFTFKFGKKKVAAAKAAAEQKPAKKVEKKSAPSGNGKLAKLIKPLIAVVVVLLVVGGGGAAYMLFLNSPVPNLEDVPPEKLEEMKATAKAPAEAGGKLLLVQAQGDDFSPTFYVATNLAEGTQVTLKIDGIPGTLVNAISFSQSWTAAVEKTKLAVFRSLSVEGKPLPMGDFKIKVKAPGATDLTLDQFIGGKKNHIYDRRMKTWKEKLQGELDRELLELKEIAASLRSIYSDHEKMMNAARVSGISGPQRAAISSKWDKFGTEMDLFTKELAEKLSDRVKLPGFADRFFPDLLKRCIDWLPRLNAVRHKERERVQSFSAPVNAEAEAALLAELVAIESALTEAATKNPLEILAERAKSAAPSAAPAAPATDAAPVAPADTATPPPAAAPAAPSAAPAAPATPAVPASP